MINIIKTMIFMSITSMFWWRKNIITLLLSLELLIMSIFMLIISNILMLSSMNLMIMLTIMVAGSSLGLMLMVSLCRFFKSPNSLPLWILI